MLYNTESLNSLKIAALNVSQGKNKTSQQSADYQYYNVNIINLDEPNGKQCRFSENRVIPVIDNPSNYKISCVRFQLPSINIPILFFNNYNFSIQLTYGSTTITQFLIYVPNSTSNSYFPLLPIYDFSEITQSMNTAFQTAKLLLDAVEPTSGFDIPFITYDATTQLFRLNAEIAGYDNNLPNYIGINFSSDVFTLYCNLQDFYLDTNYTRIIVTDTFTNTYTFNAKQYYFMEQSQSSLELWSEINKIVIYSNSIPIRQELSPTQDDVQQRVLFDFNVTGISDKGIINFFPQGALRYYDLISSYPLTQIDVEFRWQNSRGDTYPIYLNLGQNCSAKIQFIKRIDLRLENE